VNFGVHQLYLVQHVAHLCGPERRMIQEIAKIVERTLEIDIVLPQRIVGVDQKRKAHAY